MTAGVPVWLDTPLTGLEVTDGRVTGVRATRDGEPVPIRARRGVLIATGGFERSEEMRRQYQRAPIGTEWTTGAAGNTGDGIRAGLDLGAATGLMDDAWWGPSIPLPSGPYFCLAERSLHHLVQAVRNEDHRHATGPELGDHLQEPRRLRASVGLDVVAERELRGLVRRLGVTVAALFAFAAASQPRTEALSLASPGTAPSAKFATDDLTTEVRHGGHGGEVAPEGEDQRAKKERSGVAHR